jgi:ribonuclease R
VTVQVSRVDLDARKIDLRLVNAPGIRTMLKNEARRADAEQQAREQKSRARAASGPEPAEQGKLGKAKRTKAAAKSTAKQRPSKTQAKSAKRKR